MKDWGGEGSVCAKLLVKVLFKFPIPTASPLSYSFVLPSAVFFVLLTSFFPSFLFLSFLSFLESLIRYWPSLVNLFAVGLTNLVRVVVTNVR